MTIRGRLGLYAALRASDAVELQVSPDLRKPWMTGKQVAERLGVDRTTVYRWSKIGVLHPALTAGGLRRYDPEEVERVAADMEAGRPIEPTLREDAPDA